MYTNEEYESYVEKLDDFLYYVNSAVEQYMEYEVELYAAYGLGMGLQVEYVTWWWHDAEMYYISEDIENYYGRMFPKLSNEQIRDRIDIDTDSGKIFMVKEYWFYK